ncbi:uncharacterized protein LOC125517593 isoform X2 [Triticum urartu]|uniref:uncharacterized protein LOC125514975 n=1 Tax=Triticum urartu TaxID=4572 RepID=UPI002043BC06|nr:uncharacterized protein LOC125514975 [Triticum urartu]XP_048538758.1 uncharacterized protein LOC125517593 isoform X2 [Triticum urartu]
MLVRATVAPAPVLTHALLMPTAARRPCLCTSACVGAVRPRLTDAYSSSPRVFPHACARHRSSLQVLSKCRDGRSGRRRCMRLKVVKMLNASNIFSPGARRFLPLGVYFKTVMTILSSKVVVSTPGVLHQNATAPQSQPVVPRAPNRLQQVHLQAFLHLLSNRSDPPTSQRGRL